MRARKRRCCEAAAADRAAVGSWVVRGFADTTGSAQAGQALSERRALEVACALVAAGVRRPIVTFAYGKTNLAVPTPDQTPEERNRRVDFFPGSASSGTPLDPAACARLRL